jgi:hypothetical protein
VGSCVRGEECYGGEISHNIANFVQYKVQPQDGKTMNSIYLIHAVLRDSSYVESPHTLMTRNYQGGNTGPDGLHMRLHFLWGQ